MDITKVQYWSKTVQGDTVDHVRIGYVDGDKELVLHQTGDNAKAAPEFYKAFASFSDPVCKACGIPAKLATGIKVSSVLISYSEDKEGTENSSYSLSASVKAGHATATLKVGLQHKYLPEGFDDAISMLVEEAERYVNGTREQTRLELESGESSDEGGEE